MPQGCPSSGQDTEKGGCRVVQTEGPPFLKDLTAWIRAANTQPLVTCGH